MSRRLKLSLLVLWLFVTQAVPMTAEAGESFNDAVPISAAPELRICSQNLARLYGERSGQNMRAQQKALIERITKARCDVIAFQEVVGESDKQAQANATRFASVLGEASLSAFDIFVAPGKHDTIRNAVAVRRGTAKVLRVGNIENWALPRLQTYGPGRSFTRLPQVVILEVEGLAGAPRKQIALVNIHLKSRAHGWKDPTGTEYEIVRMEMSEAIREWALRLSGELDKSGVVFVLGDTNSERGSAAADILSGRRLLADFASGRCRVDAELRSDCSGVSRSDGGERRERFVGLLEKRLRQTRDLERYHTYRYGGSYQILDEILISDEDLAIVMENGLPNVGTEGVAKAGSDHRLVWVELNW